MKTKISDNLTVKDTGNKIIISWFEIKKQRDGDLSILTTIPIEYGDELDNLVNVLLYHSNNNHYGLPSSKLDIKTLGIK